MKKHNILKVVLITIAFVALCTWIFPVTSFQYSQLVEGARNQVGLFDLFSYPLVALSYFGYTFVYVLLCGGLYGLLNKIPAYKQMLEKIVKGFKGREWLFLLITIVVISTLTSVIGMSFGFIILFPVIISLVLMMGYNKLVAASVTVGSVITGLIGTTLGSNTIYSYTNLLSISLFDEILTKVLILVVAMVLLIFNVLSYAKITKNSDTKDNELIPETVKVEKNKKVKIWPLVLILDLMLLVILLGNFSWNEVFKIKFFDDLITKIQGDLTINGFPILYKILGNVGPFGKWTFNMEMPFMVIITIIVLALVYRVKFDDFIDSVCDGFKKTIRPAVISVLIFVILVFSVYHPFQITLYKPILGLSKGLNVVTMSLVAFISSFINVDPIYVAQLTIPYVISVITDTNLYPLIEIIFQSIYGLAMLVLPTSVILMVTLSYLKISYGQWLKHIWKLFVELLVILIIIFMIVLIV